MDAHQRAQLQPLLLLDLKETGKELGRGAYGVVTEVIVSGTTCAAKKLHDAIIQVLKGNLLVYRSISKSFL